jgi:hypothetical protein
VNEKSDEPTDNEEVIYQEFATVLFLIAEEAPGQRNKRRAAATGRLDSAQESKERIYQ